MVENRILDDYYESEYYDELEYDDYYEDMIEYEGYYEDMIEYEGYYDELYYDEWYYDEWCENMLDSEDGYEDDYDEYMEMYGHEEH